MIERLDATVVLGLAVTLLGVVPGAWLLATQPEPAQNVGNVVSPLGENAEVVEAVTGTVVPAPIDVEELDPSVSRVLQEQGFLGRAGADDAVLLDAAVIAVLSDHDVVLRVAEGPVAP